MYVNVIEYARLRDGVKQSKDFNLFCVIAHKCFVKYAILTMNSQLSSYMNEDFKVLEGVLESIRISFVA